MWKFLKGLFKSKAVDVFERVPDYFSAEALAKMKAEVVPPLTKGTFVKIKGKVPPLTKEIKVPERISNIGKYPTLVKTKPEPVMYVGHLLPLR